VQEHVMTSQKELGSPRILCIPSVYVAQ